MHIKSTKKITATYARPMTAIGMATWIRLPNAPVHAATIKLTAVTHAKRVRSPICGGGRRIRSLLVAMARVPNVLRSTLALYRIADVLRVYFRSNLVSTLDKGMKIRDICKTLKISRTTFYRYLEKAA